MVADHQHHHRDIGCVDVMRVYQDDMSTIQLVVNGRYNNVKANSDSKRCVKVDEYLEMSEIGIEYLAT